MKKLLAACALACAASTALAANPAHMPMPMQGQQPMQGQHMMPHPSMGQHGQRMSAEEHAASLKQRLQLNDEQTAKVKAIFEAKEKDAQALRDKYKPQLEAYRNDKKKMRDKTHADIEAVLTPAQKEQFKQMPMVGGMCDHNKAGKGPGMPHHPPGGVMPNAPAKK
jgi:Spy/CpxP family protein refolding chaperone